MSVLAKLADAALFAFNYWLLRHVCGEPWALGLAICLVFGGRGL